MNTRPEFISQSKDINHEYCATVVRLGEVKAVTNTDFLGVTEVEGREIIVRRDRVHEGQIMIYVANESQLDFKFLSKNNEFADESLNVNYKEVQKQLAYYDKQIAEIPYTTDDPRTVAMVDALKEGRKQYLNEHTGYFDKKGRVRMKRLRGIPSMGYLATPEQFITYHEELKDFNWEEHVDEDFDCVYGDLFVKAYVPELPEVRAKKGRAEKAIKRFNRMIPGQFAFHYDTQQLQRNMDRLRPNTEVTISTKFHGTSAIFGNVKVKQPKYGGLYTRWFNKLPSWLQFTKDGYDVVYSSRTVIKNATLNPSVTNGFYDVDIWGEYEKILKPYIPQGMTIYGEIVGYLTGSSRGVQSLGGKVYDYGCKPGENKLMIYRIKTVEEDGSVKEWNVDDVYDYTLDLIDMMRTDDDKNGVHNATRIIPIDICYNGSLKDLYPGLCNSQEFKKLLKPRKPVEGEDKYTKDARIAHNKVLKAEVVYMIEWLSQDHTRTVEDFISDVVSHDSLIYKAWQEITLQKLKVDKRFYMEGDEPGCVNKLPREGVVLRINDDPLAEAFKLKCIRFLDKEASDVDKGKVDMEMQDHFTEERS